MSTRRALLLVAAAILAGIAASLLMREPLTGNCLVESGHLRGFMFPGARSLDCPDIMVTYEFDDILIIIHEATFKDAKTSYAGRA